MTWVTQLVVAELDGRLIIKYKVSAHQVILTILVKAEAFPRMPLLHYLPAWDLVSFLWQSCIHSAHLTTPLIIPNKKRQLFPLVTRKREAIAWAVWFWDFLWR